MLMDLVEKQKNARKTKRKNEKKLPADDAGAGKHARCPSGCFTMFKGK